MNASVIEHRVSAPAVNLLARQIKILLEKGDRAADKAQQFYVAAGQHLKQLKAQWPDEWEQIVRQQCNLGRSRAYQIMAIGDGRTTVENIRAVDAKKKRISRGESKKIRPGPPGQEVVSTLSEVADEASIEDEIRDRPALPSGARAIMSSRLQPADDLEYSPTPPWATRALIERVFPVLNISRASLTTVHEPACGEGHMAEVLREYFASVGASDLRADGYAYGEGGRDFLAPKFHVDADWLITNPPFKEKAEQFALRAIELAKVGVAIFARLQWLETVGRYQRLFRDNPPTLIAFFCERVALHMGEWEPDGSTATAYIWLVWLKDRSPRAPFWIPPCRQALTYPDDEETFTKHPVVKKARHMGGSGSWESAPAKPDDVSLDIPAFMRRGDPANAWFSQR